MVKQAEICGLVGQMTMADALEVSECSFVYIAGLRTSCYEASCKWAAEKVSWLLLGIASGWATCALFLSARHRLPFAHVRTTDLRLVGSPGLHKGFRGYSRILL